MKKLGLLGKNISYSFSRSYFGEKFKKEGITNDFVYENFDIETIDQFSDIIKNNSQLIGLNVTIPYKQAIIPLLDDLSDEAKQIGAVNTIKVAQNGQLIGYNTDYFGFTKSLQPLLKFHHKKALILGTGGAAKAIAYALQQLNISFLFVSRNKGSNTIQYSQLTEEIFAEHTIIINCTPLGTFPNTDAYPDIPYQYLTADHIAYDLVYNPEKTQFLIKAENKKTVIKNGFEMLVEQAEKAWTIWNS